MARVDPDDDSIRRFVVRHYAFDPLRHERRHQIVAAFDNERDYQRLFESLSDELRGRRSAGDLVDWQEHYSGVVLEPGHGRRHHDARIHKEAARRGVRIPDELLASLDLPSDVAVLRSSRPTDRDG